jgi:hypothetical protein
MFQCTGTHAVHAYHTETSQMRSDPQTSARPQTANNTRTRKRGNKTITLFTYPQRDPDIRTASAIAMSDSPSAQPQSKRNQPDPTRYHGPSEPHHIAVRI